MSSKPDKKSYQEDIEDSKKKNPGQGRQQDPSNKEPGKQQKDQSNQQGGRGGEQRGGQNR